MSFTRWLDQFGDQVSKIRERELGVVTLVMDTEHDEDILHSWFVSGLKPKEAAAMEFQARRKELV